ncbi:hypothetical protein [Methylorubrum zatmanii]
MATITETLSQASQDLRDATATVRGVLSEVRAIKDSTVSQTTTIINNFAARAPIKTIAVDPGNGNDANSGAGPATALKSLDAAYALASQDYILQIALLGDDTIQKRHAVSGKVLLLGVAVGAGAYGSPYVAATRKVRFAAEAINGSQPSFGRLPAGFFLYSADWRSENIDYEVPNCAADLNYISVFSLIGNGAFTLLTTTVTANVANGRGFLIDPLGGQVTLTFSGTLGTNAPGRLIWGVAAGQDPNGIWNARSNLKAA